MKIKLKTFGVLTCSEISFKLKVPREETRKVLNFCAALPTASSPSWWKSLCNAVGEQKNGKSIFFPNISVDKSTLSTPTKTFGTKSQFS